MAVAGRQPLPLHRGEYPPLHLLDDEAQRTMTRRVTQFAGLKTTMLPEGLRTRRVGDTTFVFNYGLEEHDLEALGFRRPFGLDGGRIGPAGVATVRAHPR